MNANKIFLRLFWHVSIVLLCAWTSLCSFPGTYIGGLRYTLYGLEAVKYWNVLKTYSGVTTPLYCILRCNKQPGCYSVNYHRVDHLCELCSDEITVVFPPFTLDANWVVYFRNFENIPIAAAWSIPEVGDSTPIEDTFGNAFTNPIETIASTYFRVDMPDYVFVTKLLVNFGADGFANFGVVDGTFTVHISPTTMETADDVGTPCGLYTGIAPVAILPMLLKCDYPIYGKYLKPVHDFLPPKQLFGITVYSY